jgi:hypothetical protein
LRHDSLVLRVFRSVGVAVASVIAAVVIGLASSVASCPEVSATTPEMTDAYKPPPMPLISFLNPVAVGMHVIEAVAEGIANVVELIGTPPPIAIPAPRTAQPVVGS